MKKLNIQMWHDPPKGWGAFVDVEGVEGDPGLYYGPEADVDALLGAIANDLMAELDADAREPQA